MTTIYNENVTGVVLAGGKARRMGGIDKGLIEINGQPMIQYVLDVLKPQVYEILINANRNSAQYEKFGYAVISDQLEDFQGPLAGMATAMAKAKTKYICTCPCDGPLIAKDLVTRLYSALKTNGANNDPNSNPNSNLDVKIAVAHDGNRIQPVYALLNCDLLESLTKYLISGERKIDRWFRQHHCAEVDFSDKQDCFININTPEDKLTISQQLATE
jgi:molybdopterin-guanine dinucleotide biosynthesis protein A